MKKDALTKVKNLGLGIGGWGLEVGGLRLSFFKDFASPQSPAPRNSP